MNIQQIARILDDHNIVHLDTFSSILAQDVWTKDGKSYMTFINVTDCSREQLLNWLGY